MFKWPGPPSLLPTAVPLGAAAGDDEEMLRGKRSVGGSRRRRRGKFAQSTVRPARGLPSPRAAGVTMTKEMRAGRIGTEKRHPTPS
jgi:hypothetical protein